MGSGYAGVLLLINLAIQVVFVVLVWGIVEVPEFGEGTVDGFRAWRRNAAHSVTHMDTLSQLSLASRVCSGDAGLESSASQAYAYARIVAYLKTSWAFSPGDGIMMAVLALTMWYLSIGREITTALSLMRAVWALPRGPRTVLAADGDAPLSTRFESVTRTRVACILAMQVSLSSLLSLQVLEGL